MEALCITHVPKSVKLVDELQLPKKRTKSVDLSVFRSNCRSPYKRGTPQHTLISTENHHSYAVSKTEIYKDPSV